MIELGAEFSFCLYLKGITINCELLGLSGGTKKADLRPAFLYLISHQRLTHGNKLF